VIFSADDKVDEEARAPKGEEETEAGSEEGEKKGFGENLADDAGSAGAEGQAGGEFALAGGGFRQEEVGEVGAGYEEDEDDNSHEDVQGLLIENAHGGDARFAGKKFDEGLLDLLTGLGGEWMGFVIGEVLLGLGGDPCLSLFQIGVGFASSHEMKPLEPAGFEHGGLEHDFGLHGDGKPHIG